MSKFDKAYDRLISSAQALVRTAESHREEARKVFDGEIKPPDNCPSAASLVDTILRDVRGEIREVTGAAEDVVKAVEVNRP